MSSDHAYRSITGADEMERKEKDEMSVEKWWNEFYGREKREEPQDKPTQTPFRPQRNPQGVIETWTRNSNGGKRAPKRLSHGGA